MNTEYSAEHSDFYRVVVETPPCLTCNSGTRFAIVFTDRNGEECELGTLWGGPADDESVREHVEDHCADLNHGWRMAREVETRLREKLYEAYVRLGYPQHEAFELSSGDKA